MTDRLETERYRHILVLQTAFLGDAILTTPFLRGLKTVFPEARVDVLAIPETAEVFRNDPHVDDVLLFRKRNPLIKPFSLAGTALTIKKRNYDLAVSIQSSVTSSFIMRAGGVPERHGFSRQKGLTMSVPHLKKVRKVEKINHLLSPFAEGPFDIRTELYPPQADQDAAARIFEQGGSRKNIAVAPGSVWATKRWTREGYRDVCRKLTDRDFRVFLIGGPADRPLCEDIAGRSGAVNTAGKLSVLGSAALIGKTDLLITNDSAPLHMGNAMRTDVLAIFGPTVRRLGFAPFGEHDRVLEREMECRPCGRHGGRHCPLGHHWCMKDISPNHVLHNALEMVGDE